MRERPILMSGPMVRAILEGRKTMTRRPIRWHAKDGLNLSFTGLEAQPVGNVWALISRGRLGCWEERAHAICPYGVAGDRLWVRETWRFIGEHRFHDHRSIYWRADSEDWLQGRWTPSIHMPRWASRITLEVEEVRVERVQSISEEDAIAEGCEPMPMVRIGGANPGTFTSARESFRSLWDSINAKHGFGWEANPWVFAITFRPLEVRNAG